MDLPEALFKFGSKKKNSTLKKCSYILEWKRKFLKKTLKIIKFFYIFSKESFSYILGNENLEKIPCISRSGTFLYFRKRKP